MRYIYNYQCTRVRKVVGIMKKITIKDIARIAGVSHSTVSRSLNDSPVISEKTKDRIKKIARELDFEFNSYAQGLSKSKTNTIGVIITDVFGNIRSDIFFSQLISCITRSILNHGFSCVYEFVYPEDTEQDGIKTLIKSGRIDGLFISHAYLSCEKLELIIESGMPYIFMHSIPEYFDEQKVHHVFTDQVKGGFLATEHLLKLGHQKVACVTGNPWSREFKKRTQGYKEALEAHRVPFREEYLFCGDLSFNYGYDVVTGNPEIFKKVTGIFVQTDIMALGVIKGLHELGIKIPGQAAVVGYDDIELSTYFDPKLSTIHQPIEEMARIAGDRLIHWINSDRMEEPLFQKVLEPGLIVRESSGC